MGAQQFRLQAALSWVSLIRVQGWSPKSESECFRSSGLGRGKGTGGKIWQN